MAGESSYRPLSGYSQARPAPGHRQLAAGFERLLDDGEHAAALFQLERAFRLGAAAAEMVRRFALAEAERVLDQQRDPLRLAAVRIGASASSCEQIVLLLDDRRLHLWRGGSYWPDHVHWLSGRLVGETSCGRRLHASQKLCRATRGSWQERVAARCGSCAQVASQYPECSESRDFNPLAAEQARALPVELERAIERQLPALLRRGPLGSAAWERECQRLAAELSAAALAQAAKQAGERAFLRALEPQRYEEITAQLGAARLPATHKLSELVTLEDWRRLALEQLREPQALEPQLLEMIAARRPRS